MTVLVTGASGHVGATLVRRLLAAGRVVRALIHNDRRALEGLPVEIVEGDICVAGSLPPAFAGAEVVYHVAGYVSILTTEWERVEATNVRGTRNVVAACLASGVRRLVHFSSIEALVEEPLDLPVDENRPRAEGPEHLPYARSKALGEKAVRQGIAGGLDAVIVNPTAIVGPFDYRIGPMTDTLLRLAHGTLPALVEGGYDWVDVRDVVEAAISAEGKAERGAQYLVGGRWVSVTDIARLVSEVTGVAPPRFVAPMWLARLGAPSMTLFSRLTGTRALYTSASLKPLRGNRHFSHAHAAHDLGYNPRPIEETIRDTMYWLREQGYWGAPDHNRGPIL